ATDTELSLSMWVWQIAGVGHFDPPWYKGACCMTNPGYDMKLGAGIWEACYTDGTATPNCVGWGNERALGGHWNHLALVLVRSGPRINFATYLNGAVVN